MDAGCAGRDTMREASGCVMVCVHCYVSQLAVSDTYCVEGKQARATCSCAALHASSTTLIKVEMKLFAGRDSTREAAVRSLLWLLQP